MSLPVTFANLNLSGYPTNSIGEAEVPASLLDSNFSYLANTTVNTINQYTGNAIITQFGSLNVFTVTAAATVQLPIANSNNANPGILAINNSTSSTANLTIVPNGNSANVIVGATTMIPGSTMLFFSDGNNTWYNPKPQVLPVLYGGTGTTSIGANGSVAVSNGSNLTYVNPLPVSSGGTGTSTIGANNSIAVSNGSNLTYVNPPLPVSLGGTGTSTIGANNSIAVSNGSNLTYVNSPLPVSLGGTGTTSIGAAGTKAVSNGSNLVYVNDTLVEVPGGSSGNYTIPTFRGSQLFFFTGSSAATWTLPVANVTPAYTMQVIISNVGSANLSLTSSSVFDNITLLSPLELICYINDGGNAWHCLWTTAAAPPKPVANVIYVTTMGSSTVPTIPGWQVIYDNGISATYILPYANSYPAGGMVISGRTTGQGQLTFAPQSGDTIEGGGNWQLSYWGTLVNDGNHTWIKLAGG